MKLEALKLQGRPSDRMIESLANSQLVALDLMFNSAGSELPDLSPLQRMARLESLAFTTNEWPIPRVIKETPQIRQLSIQKRPVRAADLAALASLENLRDLKLGFVTLDSSALEQLGRLSSLQTLYISGAEFSLEELSVLRSALRSCKITGTGPAFSTRPKK